MTDRRFIEESFPVREVSAISAKEKNIRHRHISTLHIWWARRDILEANGGQPPRVLDPFAGGGAIPLDALRLGCETYASDYNPVAVLILKATLEYPQKYGTRMDMDAADQHGFLENIREHPSNPRSSASYFRIMGDGYAPWPEDFDPGQGTVSRAVATCPVCGAEIPLMRQFWLAKKAKKRLALWMDRTRIHTDATDEHGFSENIREHPSNPRLSVSQSSAAHRLLQRPIQRRQDATRGNHGGDYQGFLRRNRTRMTRMRRIFTD